MFEYNNIFFSLFFGPRKTFYIFIYSFPFFYCIAIERTASNAKQGESVEPESVAVERKANVHKLIFI